jgi:alpha-beta hydrolase superfamily lysophospholipase
MPAEINLTPTGAQFEIPSQGTTISAKSWGTASACRAAALLVHGIGAHSGWFEALARRLKVKQIYTVAYDQVGFGKRRQEELTTYQQWLDDLKLVYQNLQEHVGDKPIFIMGNSMGGVVSLCGTPSICPAGLVLFSPGFEGNPSTFTLPFRLKGIAQALLSPDSEICLPYSCEAFVRDEATRNWVANDPESRLRVPAKMLLQLLKLTKQVAPQAKLIKCPVLIATAGRDKIVDNQAISTVFDMLSVPHKKRRHFVDAYHDMMFDPVIDDLTNEVVNWISECTRKLSVEV